MHYATWSLARGRPWQEAVARGRFWPLSSLPFLLLGLYPIGVKAQETKRLVKLKITSAKGISSIKPEMGILIIYSYSVIDVRT